MDAAKQIVNEIRAKLAELERALGVVPTPPPAEPEPELESEPELDEPPAPVSATAAEKVYNMFGAKSTGNDAIEDEEETNGEEDGAEQDDSYEEVNADDAVNLLDAEKSTEEENLIYEDVCRADEKGFTAERISVTTGFSLTKVKKVLNRMFLENRIARVGLRPSAYRVK